MSEANKGGVNGGSVSPVTSRKTAAQIVKEWAEGLTPANAPDQRTLGPLAWVRGQKVQQLIDQLAKAGYR